MLSVASGLREKEGSKGGNEDRSLSYRLVGEMLVAAYKPANIWGSVMEIWNTMRLMTVAVANLLSDRTGFLSVSTSRLQLSWSECQQNNSGSLARGNNFFSLWVYSPILGLGRLHETFRFISVTRSRTVDWAPWTGDQLVARPLLTAPGDCDDGEVGAMDGFGRRNRSTRRKPAPTPICPP
jgi:hypothetical protein